MAQDNSFDIVSKVEIQEVRNAIDQALKEIRQRFDLKDSHSEVKLADGDKEIQLASDGEYHIEAVKEIFSMIGGVVEIEEKLMDAVTAISGSGPAYFFALMEELIRSAVALGIDRKTAKTLVVKTALGSAKLIDSIGS